MTAVSLFHFVGWVCYLGYFGKLKSPLQASKQASVERGLVVTFSEHAIHSTWTAPINLNSRSLNNHWPSHRDALIITCDVTTCDGICPAKNSLFPIVIRVNVRNYSKYFFLFFARNNFRTSKISNRSVRLKRPFTPSSCTNRTNRQTSYWYYNVFITSDYHKHTRT